MKKYDAQEVQAKFEKKLNKVARKLDRADEKGRELSIILLRCKIASLANKRARQMEKFETNGVAVKPELVFDDQFVVRFKVDKGELCELSQDEVDKTFAGAENSTILQTVKTNYAKTGKDKEEKSL